MAEEVMRVVQVPNVTTPHGNTVVWRYMGIDQFLDLLLNQRLFFANARVLTDRYEVTIPSETIEHKRRTMMAQGINGPALERKMASFLWGADPMKDLTLVNCWSIGPEESYALWKIYLGGAKSGVAVRSSVSRIKRALSTPANASPEDVYIGKVRYSDFTKPDELTRFSAVTTKRPFYQYENELRLFILRQRGDERPDGSYAKEAVGRHVSVDLALLAEEIMLSPFAGEWLQSTLETAIKKIRPHLGIPLVLSGIRDQ